MHLYSLTLQKASGITAAVFGNFSAPKQQELIVARGKILELMRPDDNGKVQTIHSSEVFGIIRSIATFRLTGPPWQQQPPTHARRLSLPSVSAAHRWQPRLRRRGFGLG